MYHWTSLEGPDSIGQGLACFNLDIPKSGIYATASRRKYPIVQLSTDVREWTSSALECVQTLGVQSIMLKVIGMLVHNRNCRKKIDNLITLY